jgi:hypothetical protein
MMRLRMSVLRMKWNRRAVDLFALASTVLGVVVLAAPEAALSTMSPTQNHALFATASECMACHNNLRTPSGEDVSLASDWRATMMANSSRDPYWQASVRRETIDHPRAVEEIEAECSICHMPMSSTLERAEGGHGQIFAHLPVGAHTDGKALLAADGVSCTACHQITDEKLGTPESFTGGYVIDLTKPDERPMFGRFDISAGHARVMRSATGFKPAEGRHIDQSELCATCHTLYTEALGPDGKAVGRLPEQVPYLEWRHSDFREEKSCQGCHMPRVTQPTPLTNILGEPRELARHVFQGGNFFMLGMLNRFRAELGVAATSTELDRAVRRTIEHLKTETATLEINRAVASGDRLDIDVTVKNLSGHKFPTAYPSRRAWLHLTVRGAAGDVLFESGAIRPDGSIEGNDNDLNPLAYEAHYQVIDRADQVQIYESIMADSEGALTTGLLRATRFVKDNRLLPRGFDKSTAEADFAVIGAAFKDADFAAAEDRVRYSVNVPRAEQAFTILVELRFQPISFRWAENLRSYNASEARRFNRYYDAMAGSSTEVIASVTRRAQ